MRDLSRLGEAMSRAVLAQLNLAGLMAAHGVSRHELPLLLEVPGAVRHSIDDCHAALLAVAEMLASRDGVECWTALPTQRKKLYQALAYEAVLSTPVPTVPHASGSPRRPPPAPA